MFQSADQSSHSFLIIYSITLLHYRLFHRAEGGEFLEVHRVVYLRDDEFRRTNDKGSINRNKLEDKKLKIDISRNKLHEGTSRNHRRHHHGDDRTAHVNRPQQLTLCPHDQPHHCHAAACGSEDQGKVRERGHDGDD